MVKKRKYIGNEIAGWAKIRRRIIERDNYRCRICKKGVEDTDNSLN
jgi:5-methylcytosine-specific restriction endonuclease McrA